MSVPKWTLFVQRCLLQRIDGDEFQDMADTITEKRHVAGQALLNGVVRSRGSFCPAEDPLIPLYVHALVALGLVKVSDVLFALIQIWNQSESRKAEELQPGVISRADASITRDLADIVASDELSEELDATRKCLILSSRWLSAIMKWLSQLSSQTSIHPTLALIEAIGSLIAALASSHNGVALLANKDKSEPRDSVKRVLNMCQPFMANISMQLHARLDGVQKKFELFGHASVVNLETRPENPTQIDPLHFESTVLDGIPVRTRAGMFAYFNASLSGRPQIDDHKIVSFLNARYRDDHESMFNDLVVAHFDVVAAVVLREEPQQALRLCRSSLTSKLPPLLSLVAESSLESISSEQCLSQALPQIDSEIASISNATPNSSQHTSVLREIRQQFLTSCHSHKLISTNGIMSILGTSPTQKQPSGNRYVKDELVQQIRMNSSRVERLVGELSSDKGNAQPIVQAIIEVMHRYCQNKETAPLKELCSAIVRRPETLEMMTLFSPAAYILGPLCALLDNWKWGDLHGESQPVYDEFGGILLLVLAFRYRLNLTPAELGARDDSSFVRRLIESNSADRRIDELDEATSKHLGDWISALFIAEQLSDELTSSCSPQEYYSLVPALLNQSLEACERGKLSLETLKSGFDYLLEPFFFPSLVIAIVWLVHNIWESNGSTGRAANSIQLLQALTKPPASPEARATHKTILAIVAEPLRQLLESLPSSKAANPDLTALLASILPTEDTRCTNTATRREIESWASTPGGMLGSIRTTFLALLDWDTSLTPSARLPTKFTYRQLDTAVQFHGAASVLHVLLDELALLSGTPQFEPALDILSSLICARAGSPSAAGPLLGLHEALLVESTNLPQILKAADSDLAYATSTVHLRRRVGVLSVVVVPPPPTAADGTSLAAEGGGGSGPIVPELTNMDLATMNLDAAAANAEIDVGAALQNAAEAHPEDIDRMLDEATAAAGTAPMLNEADFVGGDGGGGGLDVGDSMEDIFAGLTDDGDMGMGNFDDLDMEGMF